MNVGSASSVSPPPPLGGGWVDVDLTALGSNYRTLSRLALPARCAATVKADAYGLGLAPVVTQLWAEGCRCFFVANSHEALALRELQATAEVYVFNGVGANDAAALARARLRPVLNSVEQVHLWRMQAALMGGVALPCALHLDTGMNRLGLGAEDWRALLASDGWRAGLDVKLLMTHLASAHRGEHDAHTARQVLAFAELREALPDVPTSIGNSAGTLLGAATRGDLVRPGIALYGANPFDARPHPMREVARVYGRVLQVRTVGAQGSVGYGGAFTAAPGARLATVGVGYADGYRRELGNRAQASVAGVRVPVVGHVSMDLLTLDVSAVPEAEVGPGARATLIGGEVPLEEVALAAHTIPYEMLTGLGPRLPRLYLGAGGEITEPSPLARR
ncbi:MAG: alanine racemase [Pseudomonadota bacterium]